MHWAVVNTQPCCETRAQWHLQWQGFTFYAPREKLTRINRHGRKIVTARLLFPRYLFVWIEDGWHRLFRTIGITRVLMNGDEPSRVPENFIAALRSRERNGLITLPKHRFAIGQHVQVTGGLFSGARGLYHGLSSRQREIVLLDALGARVEMMPGLLQ